VELCPAIDRRRSQSLITRRVDGARELSAYETREPFDSRVKHCDEIGGILAFECAGR